MKILIKRRIIIFFTLVRLIFVSYDVRYLCVRDLCVCVCVCVFYIHVLIRNMNTVLGLCLL